MRILKIFQKLVSDGKLRNIVIVCGVLAIALIFLSGFVDFSGSASSSGEIDSYRDALQSSITEMLSEIEGVGEVRVLLTLENSSEGVYLENNSTKTKEIQPLVRGAVIVCEGGDDPVTVGRVTDAVTKSLNISTAKVCVTKLK